MEDRQEESVKLFVWEDSAIRRLLRDVVKASLESGATWLEVIGTVRSLRPPFTDWDIPKPSTREEFKWTLGDLLVAIDSLAREHTLQ